MRPLKALSCVDGSIGSRVWVRDWIEPGIGHVSGLLLLNVEDLLHERGIDITHPAVRFWWNRFGTIFAAEIRRSRIQAMHSFRHRRWHLDEFLVQIKGIKHYHWRAVDHEGELLESFATKRRDKIAALTLLRKSRQ